ncbi:MAG: folate family ECF transporter S component [Tissierellia bacterium]|nr:folate family ECF transporter S component [Tissierellia bacterium]
MNNKISLRSWLISALLAIFAIVAIRVDGKPSIYVGLIFAYIAIFLLGLFSKPEVGAIAGPIIVGAGFYLRNLYPEVSKLKGDKLEALLMKRAAYAEFYGEYMLILLIVGMFVGLFGGAIGRVLQEDKFEKFTASKISYMAVFVALSVIINTVRIGSVSFGGFPIILSGYLLGPIPGFIVGGVSDVVGFIVRPSSFGFNILYTMTSALTGLIPVLITNLLGQKYPKYTFVKVLIGVLVGQVLTSVVLVPIFSTILYKKVFTVEFIKALSKQAVSIPIYSFLIVTLNDRLGKAIKFDKI